MILRDRGHLVAALIGYCNTNGYNMRLADNVFTFLYSVMAGSPDGFNTDIVPGFGLADGDYDIDTTSRLVTVFLDHITYYPNRGVADYCEHGISRKINLCNNADEVIASQNRLMFAPQNNNSSNNSTTNTDNIKHTKRMEKIIFSESLVNRLNAAKANGSKFATIILEERKKKHFAALSHTINNYFDTVLRRSGGVPCELLISCCNKLDNERNPQHGNPQFPYLAENRARINLSSFFMLFDEVSKVANAMTPQELDYETKLFSESMIIGEKITFKVGSTVKDFFDAYYEQSYLPFGNDNVLGNSCMRGEGCSKIAADFYSFFAGAKILVGRTASGAVVSRAILWDNVVDESTSEDKIDRFIERIYYTHSHLLTKMRDEALKLGYKWRKTSNDYCSQRFFTNMETGDEVTRTVHKIVPASKWHKGGSPYMDTMCYLIYVPENQKLMLRNTDSGYRGNVLYNLQNTGGAGSRYRSICPICGKVHDNNYQGGICNDCWNDLTVPDFMGNRALKAYTVVGGVAYPKQMIMRGGKFSKLAQFSKAVWNIGSSNRR